jgi:hypothetical protein
MIMKNLAFALVFAILATGCASGFRARPTPPAEFTAGSLYYSTPPTAPGMTGYAAYGASYGFMPNMPAYVGTGLDPRSHAAIVAADSILYATTRGGTLPPPTSPTPPASTAGSPYATRADLGIVVDQVLDLNGEVRALRREVEGSR